VHWKTLRLQTARLVLSSDGQQVTKGSQLFIETAFLVLAKVTLGIFSLVKKVV